MYFIDDKGNEPIEIIKEEEQTAQRLYAPVTHCLVVVKVDGDYLLGWNRWRQNPAKISCTILLPGSPTQEAVQVMENGIVQFRLFPCYVLIRKGGV